MTKEELRDYVDQQRSLDNIPYHVYSTLIDGIDTLEQEPVLEKIRTDWEEYPIEYTAAFDKAIEALKQEQKTGYWIEVDTNMYGCNNCNYCFTLVPEDNHISQFKYCPNCGAKKIEVKQ